MGAEFSSEHGFLIASAPGGLSGAQIWLDFPSVGATENILMAAALAKGRTVIDNAAREPEIVDLCQMLLAMGGRDRRRRVVHAEYRRCRGTRPVTHATVPDRIVAGTWAAMAAITGGDITIDYARIEHLEIAMGQTRHGRCACGGDGCRLPGQHAGSPLLSGHRHPSLPRFPDRSAASVHRAQLGR